MFTVTVLNEVLTYEVDRIVIVEPQEVNNLEITSGKDYVTLLTCTPYGVNTHRLLVRGKRIATAAPELVVRVSSDAVQIEPMVVASVIAVPLLIITFSLTIIGGSIRQKHKKKKKGMADNFDAKAGEDSGSYSKYGYNYKSHYYDSYGYGEETSEDKDESKKDKSDNKVKKEKK